MKCAVLVPTCDRPGLLKRALLTFASAAESTDVAIARVVVADDSVHSANTAAVLDAVRAVVASFEVEHLRPAPGGMCPGGPGRTRTRGLRHLKRSGVEHDGVLMFDDDVAFADCIYQGTVVASAGRALLAEIAQHRKPETILGCSYVGRQDLTVLEHIVLLAARGPSVGTEASSSRGHVRHEAPGGISGALVFAPTHAAELPEFLPWYNEDYFWLRRMMRDGWRLLSSEHALAHAPEDGLSVSVERLCFEQHGEFLWDALAEAPANGDENELGEGALKQLRVRLDELRDARRVIMRSRNVELRRVVAPALEGAEARLQDVVREVGSAPLAHPLLEDLRHVARYCGV
jgi:hypothetical protein